MIKADKNYKSFADNVSEYDTYDDAIMDLKAGRVDVIVVDQVLGVSMQTRILMAL